MKLPLLDWSQLDSIGQRAALARPNVAARADIAAVAASIVQQVRSDGDAALKRLTKQHDRVTIEQLLVTPAEFADAYAQLPTAQRNALERSIANVTRFHEAQLAALVDIETMPGVRCQRVTRPIGAVGLYVPAGSAPLPSTVIMLAVPARIAGCATRVLASPPAADGSINAAVLVAAQLCGIERVLKIGGAQAIAALAFGTQTVPKVDKIFGPGNAWVTAAKQLVAADPSGAAIDMPAGPSEVMVLADDSAVPEFVAADLLAQAEHDVLSQAVLVSTSRSLAEQVNAALLRQAASLSRRAILEQSLQHSRCILVPELDTGAAVVNAYAPEHLLIQTRGARELLPSIESAGSIFLGSWSPEPLGDYCSGTNHVLPTFGYARSYSGLSVHDFQKRITVQELSAAGLRALGPTAVTLADLEGLDAHAAAVNIRLAALSKADVMRGASS